MIERKKTRQVKVRGVTIGGDAPVAIQSMTNTKTTDIEATLKQIEQLTALDGSAKRFVGHVSLGL